MSPNHKKAVVALFHREISNNFFFVGHWVSIIGDNDDDVCKNFSISGLCNISKD